MIVISDTNILSSFAAAEALPLLLRLFQHQKIHIPPTVHRELSLGLDRGRTYLAPVLQAISHDQIAVTELSPQEQLVLEAYPRKLNLGEREAIALAQSRQVLLLSNDQRAVRFCQQQAIETLDLPQILRALWLRRLVTPPEVEQIITRMAQVENLVLSEADHTRVFAPNRRRRK